MLSSFLWKHCWFILSPRKYCKVKMRGTLNNYTVHFLAVKMYTCGPTVCCSRLLFDWLWLSIWKQLVKGLESSHGMWFLMHCLFMMWPINQWPELNYQRWAYIYKLRLGDLCRSTCWRFLLKMSCCGQKDELQLSKVSDFFRLYVIISGTAFAILLG